MTTDTARARLLDDLNHGYERLHTAKEDAFWRAYMGTGDDPDAARKELDEKEIAWQGFLRDPASLARVEKELAEAKGALAAGSEGRVAADPDARIAAETNERVALEGWRATFAAHVIPSASARALADEIVEAEGRLARERASLQLTCDDGNGTQRPASSVELGVKLASDPNEAVRRSAWQGLRAIEPHVLAKGFLDVVRMRNRLGRELGGEDYYDWKVRRVEGLSKAEVFAWLDELEARTRDAARRGLDALRAKHGAKVTPWNARFLASGDVSNEQDPFFPFEKALERWGTSFSALGVRYRGAELVLDLVDRKGKYENGFMHGPVPAWREHGKLRPARIQFTANAIPGLVGAGRRATDTLFHEGGHAAHFANIDMPAPCFAQEYAPSSVAFAETQSMFLESLLRDADWQVLHARDLGGNALPDGLVEKAIERTQPLAAWGLRGMLAICFAERAIYELDDRELTAERVLAELRRVERELLFLDDGAPRPTLSVPHLLSGESSAYYHGYVLAEMAVEETRDFFLARDGRLADNARIGPDLERAYWQPGNALGFGALVERLIGRPLSARALATRVQRTVDEAREEARTAIRAARARGSAETPVALDASIRVVDGRETIAEARTAAEFDGACRAFEAWIGARARARRAGPA
ncbi:MAG: peptidase M3 [Planctomycetes bacterium]|nr:peptidase M3 [Planctomycetota bacterium]